MFDADKRDRSPRERSLLSLVRRAGETPEDAAAGRAAPERFPRREVRPSPILAALAAGSRADYLESAGAPPPDAESPPPVQSEPRWTERLFGWARRAPASEPAAVVAEDASEPAPVEREPAGWPAELVRRPPHRYVAEPAEVQQAPLLDPVYVARRVWRSKGLILSTTILGCLIGVAVALSVPKKYEAVAELLVDPRDLQLIEPGVSPAGLPSDATLAIVENQVRVLTSGKVLAQVVEKLRLADDPEFNGEGGGIQLGALVSRLRELLAPQSGSGGGDRRLFLATEHLYESLNVERGGKTFVISVGAVTQDAEKSALIANTVVDEFVRASGRLQSDTAGRAADELTGRLDQLRADLEAAERKVEAFKAENDIIDAQGRLITDDEIVRLNEQLANARASTLDLNARAASARAVDVDAVLSGDLPEQIASGAMSELRAQYARFKQEVDNLAVRLGPRHPQRMAGEAQLQGIRDEIRNELRRIASSLQVQLKRAVQLEQELASRLAQLKVRQGGLSNELVTLRELERDATAKRAIYEALLLRAREAGEQSGINTANISILSTAAAPILPLGPSRMMMALAGLGIGFLSGVGLAGLRGAYESVSGGSEPARRRDEAEDFPSAEASDPPHPSPDAAPTAAAGPVRRQFSSDNSVSSSPQPAGEASPGDDSMRHLYAQQAAPEQLPHPPYAAYPQPYATGYPYPPAPAEPGMIWVQAPAFQHPAQQQAQQVPHPAAPAQPAWPQHAMPPQAYAQQPAQAFGPQAAWYPSAQNAAYPAPQHTVPYHQAAPQPAVQQQQAEQLAEQQAAEQEQQSSLEEIRASLREFREAVRELAETRQRRRYF